MINTETSFYYITLKIGKREIMTLVKTMVFSGESFNAIAKKMRQSVVESPSCYGVYGGKIKPSDISWAVYRGQKQIGQDLWDYLLMEKSPDSDFENFMTLGFNGLRFEKI